MSLQEQALVFRESFRQETPGVISTSGFINKRLWDLQVSLINEESCEFLDAAELLFDDPHCNNKREDVLKELSDLVFVCYQFAACFGFDLDTAMARVFASNMSKLDANGEPIYRDDGKVLKGPNYQPPSLEGLFQASLGESHAA